MPDPDQEALLRWAQSEGLAADPDPVQEAAPPQIALPPAPVGYVNAWDPGLNRYILMPAAVRSAPAPLQHVAHPTTVEPANPPAGMGRVIPFRPQSVMLVKGAGADPYDEFLKKVPEIPIPGTGGTDGMAGNYDPELSQEIADVQSEMRTSNPGDASGFVPMQGDGHSDAPRENYPNGSKTIGDLPRS